MRQGLRSLVIFLMVALSVACTVATEEVPPIERDDLIGEWTADYSQYDDPVWAVWLPTGGIERLVLHADGTFEQYFEKTAGIPFEKRVSGTWKAERVSKYRTRIYLYGAMYYLDGVRFAKKPTSGISAWDPILSERVEIGNSAGVVVIYATRLLSDSKYNSKIPCGKKYELVLQHLPIGDLDAPTWVTFCRE